MPRSAKPHPVSAAIHESFLSWLTQHGYALCRESDTQYPILGSDLTKTTRELANNAAQAVLCVQDEDFGGCSCGARFHTADAVDDHECPLEDSYGSASGARRVA